MKIAKNIGQTELKKMLFKRLI